MNLPFSCPVTALPVSYHRCLNFCTALSTWSPMFTSRDLYLRCRSLVGRAKRVVVVVVVVSLKYYFGSPEINGSNSISTSALIL